MHKSAELLLVFLVLNISSGCVFEEAGYAQCILT